VNLCRELNETIFDPAKGNHSFGGSLKATKMTL
jgi:hypothetical protein